MIKDVSNKYLIAEHVNIKPGAIKKEEKDSKKLTPGNLNKNLSEMNDFFRKGNEGFSEIKGAENSSETKETQKTGREQREIASGHLALATSVTSSALPSPQIKALNIIYTNDIHGAIKPELKKKGTNKGKHMGGVAHMSTVIKDLKQKGGGNSLVLDGGDFSQGSYESGMTKGTTMVNVMNNVGYDAVEVGNHEFDWSKKDLKNMADRAKFDILGANISSGKPGEIGNIKPYTIKEINGVKVGILGLITPDTSEKAKGKNLEGITIGNSIETAEKYIKEMKKGGADLVVVLSHQGTEKDRELAGSVRGIDVIVGGHSHTETEKPEEVKGTLIVQAGSHGESVGNLSLEVDSETKKIRSFNNQIVPVNADEIKPDPEVEKIIKPALKKAEEKKAEIVGKSSVPLTHERKEAKETVLGNVITDAMRDSTGADIALINSGGIKADIPEGNITFGNLHDALPYESHLVTMELTGQEIKNLMENSAARDSNNLQVSGISMNIDREKKVSNIMIGGKPLVPEKKYRVTADDFLASGGDNYEIFTEGKNVTPGPFVIESLQKYLKKNPVITEEKAKIEGRLNY